MHDAPMGYIAGETDESGYIINQYNEADHVFRLITRHFNRSLYNLQKLISSA